MKSKVMLVILALLLLAHNVSAEGILTLPFLENKWGDTSRISSRPDLDRNKFYIKDIFGIPQCQDICKKNQNPETDECFPEDQGCWYPGRAYDQHGGNDYGVPKEGREGYEEVWVVGAAPGYVTKTVNDCVVGDQGCGGGFGNHIRKLLDQKINGQTVEIIYAHCKEGSVVVEKDGHVERGNVLCVAGNTGISTGDHLHFEVRIDGTMVDPYDPTRYLWSSDPPVVAFSSGIYPGALFTVSGSPLIFLASTDRSFHVTSMDVLRSAGLESKLSSVVEVSGTEFITAVLSTFPNMYDLMGAGFLGRLDSGKIYLFWFDGKWHHVTSMEALNEIGYSSAEAYPITPSLLYLFPEGEPIGTNSGIRRPGDGVSTQKTFLSRF
jgi:hypothetical protein